MKKHLLFISLYKHIGVICFISFLTIISSCYGHESFDDQLNGLGFTLLTFDYQVEQKVFNSGSDIYIALKVTKKSNKEIEWYFDHTCLLFQTEQFLFVYKKMKRTKTVILLEPHINLP